MTLYAILALAVALAMDAFAVALASGARLGSPSRAQTARMALAFGFFQFLMPVVGWALGLSVRDVIEAWDHWIAFVLLAVVGVNMIRESHGPEETAEASPYGKAKARRADPTRGKTLVMLAVATSIDALAVGLSFAMIRVRVWGPALIIGIVCAGLTAAGLLLGSRLARARALGRHAGLAGGVVLLLIGFKILGEHGVFAGVL